MHCDVTTQDCENQGFCRTRDADRYAVRCGKKQQHSQRLVLRARRQLRIGRQAGEERLDPSLAHLRRMALAAVQDEAPYPVRIGLLGAVVLAGGCALDREAALHRAIP
ncbi:hypothetical protein XACLE20_960006 [Xanthomonas citri pv. citri]|nr:hypothetical protein XACLE20_960006 [Xanthomonas citri pv. citri]CEH44102.1 hypothetical protein XACLE3_4500006 [Xanthomonas citri pv. citri]